MFDINYIMNGTSKVSKQKPKKQSQFNFKLIGKPIGILGDRVTPKQRVAIKRDPWGDWDKDGVINGLDCQPRNKKKHMAYTKTVDLNPKWVDQEITRDKINPPKPGSRRIYMNTPQGAVKPKQLTGPQESEVYMFDPNLQEGSATVKIFRPYEEITDRDTALEFMDDHPRSVVNPKVGSKILSHMTPNYAFETKIAKNLIPPGAGFIQEGKENAPSISISKVAEIAAKSQGITPITQSPFHGIGSHHEHITTENTKLLREKFQKEAAEDEIKRQGYSTQQ
jgi:hypothetical protein